MPPKAWAARDSSRPSPPLRNGRGSFQGHAPFHPAASAAFGGRGFFCPQWRRLRRAAPAFQPERGPKVKKFAPRVPRRARFRGGESRSGPQRATTLVWMTAGGRQMASAGGPLGENLHAGADVRLAANPFGISARGFAGLPPTRGAAGSDAKNPIPNGIRPGISGLAPKPKQFNAHHVASMN